MRPVSDDGRRNDGDTDTFVSDEQESHRKSLAWLEGHGVNEDWSCGTAYAGLEREINWPLIFENADRSFRKRVVLVRFISFAQHTNTDREPSKRVGYSNGPPDVLFRRDGVAVFDDLAATEETLQSGTGYGRENIFCIRRQ